MALLPDAQGLVQVGPCDALHLVQVDEIVSEDATQAQVEAESAEMHEAVLAEVAAGVIGAVSEAVTEAVTEAVSEAVTETGHGGG